MKCTQALVNPQVVATMRAALAAQLTLWQTLAELEALINHPGGDQFQDNLMEFAIGIDDPPDAIPAPVITRAIAWVCYGQEVA